MTKRTVVALVLAASGMLAIGLAAASSAEAANVTVSRTGRGSVTGPGISCPSDCTQFILAGDITLTAHPASGWTVGRWSGRCTGSTSRTCTFAVPIFEDVTVSVRFDALPAQFTVNTATDALDTDPGDGACRTKASTCSLRAAIQETNALVRAAAFHRINLPADTFRLAIPGAGETGGVTGDLNIRSNVQIFGAGADTTSIDGNGLDRVLEVASGVNATIWNVTLRNGAALLGGGVRNWGVLRLFRVVVSGNTSIVGGSRGAGGGIHNNPFGHVDLIDSTVSGNTAGTIGGGIFNQGSIALVNATLSGNTSLDEGGGLLNSGFAALTNVTVSGNTATDAPGGGLFNAAPSSLQLENVILGGNVARASAGNCAGEAIAISAHNISSDASCAAWLVGEGDRNATDPRLGPLQSNGGSTPTQALLPGSPAIDAARCLGGQLAHDQRGIPRPIGSGCDIGAVEFQGSREEFVTRFYADVLGRDPEADGLAAWTALLRADCSPQSFAILSGSFFDSLEFRTRRPYSVDGLVTLLYRTFLGRDPDAAGLAGWASVLRQVRLAVALEGFVPSREFQTLLPDRTDRAAVADLVSRLYRQLLGRDPDPAGLQSFVDYIATTGDLEGAATGFLASPEFESRPMTARDYVAILYVTFLDRRPDEAGLDAWEGVLRQALLAIINTGFVPSPEFQGLVPLVCG